MKINDILSILLMLFSLYMAGGAVRAHDGGRMIVWLDDAIPYDERCTRLVAEEYAADIYRGQMGSEEYNRTLQHWLNEKTGGLLSDRAREEAFNADTAFAIASTFYFNGKWEEAFDKAQTHDAVFHGATGSISASLAQAFIVRQHPSTRNASIRVFRFLRFMAYSFPVRISSSVRLSFRP